MAHSQRTLLAGRRPDRVRPHGGPARRRPPAALASRGRAAGGGDVAGARFRRAPWPTRRRCWPTRRCATSRRCPSRSRRRSRRRRSAGPCCPSPSSPSSAPGSGHGGRLPAPGARRRDVGHLGMYRDEESLRPVGYYESLPAGVEDADGLRRRPDAGHRRQRHRRDRRGCARAGAQRLHLVGLVAAPEGIRGHRTTRTPACRSPSRRSTASSTNAATSAPASATPATGCSGPRRRRPGSEPGRSSAQDAAHPSRTATRRAARRHDGRCHGRGARRTRRASCSPRATGGTRCCGGSAAASACSAMPQTVERLEAYIVQTLLRVGHRRGRRHDAVARSGATRQGAGTASRKPAARRERCGDPGLEPGTSL